MVRSVVEAHVTFRRIEDERLLTGRGRYVGDIRLDNMAEAVFVRSPHAHARIRSIEVDDALASPGVIGVWTFDDLDAYFQRPLPPWFRHPAFRDVKSPTPLAKGIVRHVGEAVAVVVAVDRHHAEDAAGKVKVTYDPLPPVVDLEEAAAATEGPFVHEDLGSNVVADYTDEVGDVDEAMARAAHRVKLRLRTHRGAGLSLEGRATLASWDEQEGVLTVWDSTQGVLPLQNSLSEMLQLPKEKIRVIAPDVGGGFGPKHMLYPEELVIPYLARKLGRPVRWLEDRLETFIASAQQRDQEHEAELGIDEEGRIVAVRTDFLWDAGAYNPYGLIVPIVAGITLPGPYRIPNYRFRFRAVLTNKPVVAPVRGSGRPDGVFVMERLLDAMAEQSGIDRLALRRINLLSPDDFPYDVGLKQHGGDPVVYDSANPPALFDKVVEMSRWEEQQGAPAEDARRGRRTRRGVGIASFVESAGRGPAEACRVALDRDGKVRVLLSAGTQGQGIATMAALLAAAPFDLSPSEVHVELGDSHLVSVGQGTYGSRSAVLVGNAVSLAAEGLRDEILLRIARRHQRPIESLSFRAGEVYSGPDYLGSLPQLAEDLAEEGETQGELLLEVEREFEPKGVAYSSGVAVALVEVDPELGTVKVPEVYMVHDCGHVINPLTVHGQIVGAIAHGVGNALFEHLVYDDKGQLLTGSLMDYLVVTAADAPRYVVEHIGTPSPTNPLGVKGTAEAGICALPAAIVQAVEHALDLPWGTFTQLPLHPETVLEALAARNRLPGRTQAS